MPSSKARYKGDGTWSEIKDFSDALKKIIRGYYPNQQAETCPTFGHPADNFVSHILATASGVTVALHWHQFDITKQEIRAEQSDLLKNLNDLNYKLRNLSPNFERLLGIDADNLGCADKIEELIKHVETTKKRIKNLPTAKKLADKQHDVMVEMAIRILPVLKEYGIAPAATGNSYFQYTSPAIQILKAIGDDVGLKRNDLTWRNAIIKTKNAATDL